MFFFHLQHKLATWFYQRHAMRIIHARQPDKVIYTDDITDPYMHRWYLIPKNPLCSVMINQVFRSDDDRAHHDHPWANASIPLDGRTREHVIHQGGRQTYDDLVPGTIRIRWTGRFAHRLEMMPGEVYTSLFITGPRYRQWGFHCPFVGWVHWKDFTADEGRKLGKGCD